MPVVARLGFDHGWLCMSRCFLNFGRPVLLVDRLLLGDHDVDSLGLEPFGSRDPRRALPEARARVEFHEPLVGLCTDRHPGPAVLLAWHRYEQCCAAWRAAAASPGPVVLFVGDTEAVQASWVALFDCHVGLARTTSLAWHPRPAPGRSVAA